MHSLGQAASPAPVPRAPVHLMPRQRPAGPSAARLPCLCSARLHALHACHLSVPRRAGAPAARPAPCRGLTGRVAALCCDTVQQPTASAVTIQFFCIAIQFFPQPTFSVAIQLPAHPTVLQYTFLPGQPLHNLAIQFSVLQFNFLPMLQYNPSTSCNTISTPLQYKPCLAIQMGSSPFQICTIIKKKFLFFSL